MQTCSWEPCLRVDWELVDRNLAWEPVPRNLSWESVLGSLPGFKIALPKHIFRTRCLQTFLKTGWCETCFRICSQKALLGNQFLAAYSWETALEDLAWEPVLGDLFSETRSLEPCLGTCSWKSAPRNLFLGALPGNLDQHLFTSEPCT